MKKRSKNYTKPSIKIRKLKINFLFIHQVDDYSNFLTMCGTGCTGTCSQSCFLAGTQITMADNTSKSIESIQKGDKIISFDLEKKMVVKASVAQLFIHPNDNDGYYFINSKVKATRHHLFWTENDGWKGTYKLSVGDYLLDMSGNKIKIEKIEKVEGTFTVYNLHTDHDTHNFFADNILVHNEKCE